MSLLLLHGIPGMKVCAFPQGVNSPHHPPKKPKSRMWRAYLISYLPFLIHNFHSHSENQASTICHLSVHCIFPDYIHNGFRRVIYYTSLVAQRIKNPPAVWETWVRSLGWEDPLEKGKPTHSSILAWRTPWTIHRVTKSQTQLSDFHFHTLDRSPENKAYCLGVVHFAFSLESLFISKVHLGQHIYLIPYGEVFPCISNIVQFCCIWRSILCTPIA